jgi:hypothetical protein
MTSLLVGCSRHAAIDKAKADFAAQHPDRKIVQTFLGENDANHAVVHVHYLYTSASQFPQKTTVVEARLSYERTSGTWNLAQVASGTHVRPAN